MVNNNNNKDNKNKELKIGLDGRFIYDDCKFAEKDYKFIEVNFATGDQFIKIAPLCSEDGTGTVTYEQVKKFYDEAEKESREWQKNHPGESVTIRVSQGEGGKQVIKVTPANDLICPSNFRSRIYDQNGE